jgi:hypothetical protein
MVDPVKVYLGKGYSFFFRQKLTKEIDGVSVGFDRIVTVTLIFWEENS